MLKRSMRRSSPRLAVLAVTLLAAGCGGDGSASPPGAAPAPRGPQDARLRAELAKATAVTPDAFPATQGRTLQQVSNTITRTGPQLAFATSVLTTGTRERLAFGLIDQGTNFLYAPTALYLAPSGGKAKALGPFVAPADLLVTDTPFRSKTAASEESVFAAVYAATVPFAEPGMYDVLAVAKVAGKDVAAGSQVKVVRPAEDKIPDVGERPPSVETDTLASARGDVKAIDTREPPGTMHDASFADVLAKKPTVLLFATPQLCQSRVCGPVVDVTEQLKRTYADRVQFIHQEVFVDNVVEKGLRPPLEAFNLKTEPWLFAVNEKGRITTRLEGSFGFDAVERAIKSALR
ncbi:MAG: hypothetical protein M3417_15495 [Actinomycetota bacterium]|nr:hypothetical protein [Actinomycetota bacterium]